jgi:hypothetical protein
VQQFKNCSEKCRDGHSFPRICGGGTRRVGDSDGMERIAFEECDMGYASVSGEFTYC